MILVFTAASVKAGDVLIDVMEDEQLGGAYFSNTSDGSWYIKFSAKVEGEEIVSSCELWSRSEGYVVELTELKFPYSNKDSRKIDHMQIRVISSARATAQVLKNSWFPATAACMADIYWDMAYTLAKKTGDLGQNQVRFAVMYHSIIIRAALRIMKGAKKMRDICEVSPDYEATDSSLLFICAQDLHDLKHYLLPHERRFVRHTEDDESSASGSYCCNYPRYCQPALIWCGRIQAKFVRHGIYFEVWWCLVIWVSDC